MVGVPVVLWDQIQNPNVSRAVMVYGDDDLARYWNNSGFDEFTGGWDNGIGVADTTRIELVGGYTHFDYFYVPELYNDLNEMKLEYEGLLNNNDNRSIARRNSLAAKIDEQEERIERVLYADAFMARMTANSGDQTLWNIFLNELPEPVDGVYKVDPSSLFAGQLDQLKTDKGVVF